MQEFFYFFVEVSIAFILLMLAIYASLWCWHNRTPKQTCPPEHANYSAQFSIREGDFVTIRDDLDLEKRYKMFPGKTYLCVSPDMLPYSGLRARVTSAGPYYFRIDLDGGKYMWATGMFKQKNE